jgi:uncharacterized YigZ family protein
MQEDTFKTIKAPGEGLYKEKGSRFLAFANPVESVDEAKSLLEIYKKKYHDARHICYAYNIGPKGEDFRVYDDGEPSGTAGRPIFGQIQSYGLTNILVVVVRYFGGILLGTGGLALAYKSAAAESIQKGEIVEKTVDIDFTIYFESAYMNNVMRILKSFDAQILSKDYEATFRMRLRIRKNCAESIKAALCKVESLVFND